MGLEEDTYGNEEEAGNRHEDITPREMEIRDYVIRMIKILTERWISSIDDTLRGAHRGTSPASRAEKTKN